MSARGKPWRASNRPAPAPVAVPVAPRTAWRLIGGAVGVLAVSAAVVWAVAAGLPRQATLGLATASSEAGFVVRQVEISGAVNQPRLSIYREILEGGSDSMLLADLKAMQARLMALPWVEGASIQRRWPDRLHIHITERRPAALWQWRGRIRLIDADGRILPAVELQQFAHLPLLVGEGARHNAPQILKIVASRPDLAREVEAAQWVGQRRWDLRMKSGETLSLPEGPAAEAAFLHFARLNGETPLLGRGFVRFDLRLPDKMVVRVGTDPGQPVKPRADAVPQAPPPGLRPQSVPLETARFTGPRPQEVHI